MSTISPGRLNNLSGGADVMAILQTNTEILTEEIFQQKPTYQNGVVNTLNGPPTTGAHVLHELWKDALKGVWVCYNAGTPGDWRQVGAAVVATPPSSGTIGTGYQILDASDNYARKYHAGSYVWTKVYQAPAANVLINPNPGVIMQRQVVGTLTSVSDDNYGADRWNVLTQTASVQSQQVTGGRQRFAWRLKQNQASAQRFGALQIVEGVNCFHLRSKSVTFSGRLNCSSSQAIRFAILEWTGTEDSVTSDVVNDWTSSTYTPSNFFLSSNLTITGFSSITPSAATWTSFSLTATLGSACNNLIVMYWTEGTAAQNVTLDVEEMMAVETGSAAVFAPRPQAVELQMCRRYYERNGSTAPGVGGGGAVVGRPAPDYAAATSLHRYQVRKRVTPTVSLWDNGGVAGKIYIAHSLASASYDASAGTDAEDFSVTATAGGGTFAPNTACLCYFVFAADAEL
jgi:hypothetical protein